MPYRFNKTSGTFVRQLQLTVDAKLHARVKRHADKRKMTVDDVLKERLLPWIENLPDDSNDRAA